MPKVSVLLPTYNTKEDWLKESIESVLNQTFQDFEIIVLDDGSKTSPEAVIKSFNDDRIKFYINETNLGVGKTRNKLIELATGEYVAFQDSDDISLPTRLEKQVKFLDENPDFTGVSGGCETFPNKRISLGIPEPKIVDFWLFFFQFCPIFGFHSPLSRKMPFAAFMPFITFLQGYARQLQGWSKTPCF